MPSVFAHPAVPIALACVAGRKRVSPSLMAAGLVASLLPDADVVAFRFGIPYGAMFGHRGFFHSIFFAALAGAAATLYFKRRRAVSFLFVFACMASHGLLDAITDGGKGIGLLAPFTAGRYFFPWRPITVCSLSPRHFFSSEFWSVMLSEIKWVWAPCCLLGAIGVARRKRQRS